MTGGQAEMGEDLCNASSARQEGRLRPRPAFGWRSYEPLGLAFTVGSSMAAMIFKAPPHWGQCSMSISNTRLSNRAQLIRAGAEGWGTSPCSAEEAFALTGARGGRKSGREQHRGAGLRASDLDERSRLLHRPARGSAVSSPARSHWHPP